MTTIVATRTSILADSQCTAASPFKTSKLRQITCKKTGEEYLCGGAGYLEELHFIINLIELQGLDELWKLHLGEHWPPKLLKDGDTDVLVVTRNREIYKVTHHMIPMPINDPWHAMGSGGDFAKAAMLLGKTPHEAIEFAAEHDPWTKGPVHELKFKRHRKE